VSAAKVVNPTRKSTENSISRQAQDPSHDQEKRTRTSGAKQKSFAEILSCANSKSRPEIVANQSGDDIVSLRIAGNLGSSRNKDSLDYGLFLYNIPLFAVAGNSTCGAVGAVMKSKDAQDDLVSSARSTTPAMENVKKTSPGSSDSGLIEMVIKSDAWNSAEQFVAQGKFVPDAVRAGKAKIGNALSDLTSGWQGSTPHYPKQDPTPPTNSSRR
jgi:carbonic anhydrase